jgi:uncharacterized iron-regulated protein
MNPDLDLGLPPHADKTCAVPATPGLASDGRRRLLLALGTQLLFACAARSSPVLVLKGPGVLLGEVHDNAAGHALRLAAFDAWLSAGAQPALAMEMLDRGDQPAIDRLRPDGQGGRGPDAPGFVKAVLAARPAGASRGGWDWRFYTPFVERALQHGLPLVAANVGRAEARAVIKDGLAAHGFDADVPADLLDGHARSIEASHCGQVDAALARRMALAQVARDQQMAGAVEAHIARGVLLLAGNGHVRTDLGVPRWLSADTRARCECVGVLEQGDTMGAFDRVVHVAAQPSHDPCAGMRPPHKVG